MTEEGTLCGRDDVEKKCGTNANSTASAEAYTNVYIKMAEGLVSAVARYDFVTNYASMSDIGKEILRDVTSSYAAIMVINYDMSGYTSRTEAQTMLDINWSIISENLNLIRDEKFKEFIKNG